MADKISGYGRIGLDVGPPRPRPVVRNDNEPGTEATRRSRVPDPGVEITDTAARLKAVEARLAELPDVDAGKVDEIRRRIESGEYRPDPSRIAAKLLRLERDLA